MTIAHYLTTNIHHLIDPWQAALRKGRLHEYGLARDARLPVVTLRPEGGCAGAQEHCRYLVADTRRFHAINAPGEGIRRWTARSAMLLDLDRFETVDAYRTAISRRTKGAIIRQARKAARAGIHCAPIDPASYATSIEAIAASKRFRSGGPMVAAWLGPARRPADTGTPPAPPACPEHWTMAWGAFDGARLIAHFSLRRVGDMCRVFEIMCHGDYLDTGAMKLLSLEVICWLIRKDAREAQGVRWLMYGAMEHGSAGLHEWKRRMGFEPVNLLFDQPAL